MAVFKPNPLGLDELLASPTGPVVKHVVDFAEAVAVAARRNAPVDTGRAGAGALRNSIRVEPVEIATDFITVKVGADPIDPDNGFGYGLVAHEGHGVLRPKRSGGRLNFFWAKKNIDVSAGTVRATGGNPFLTKALTEVNSTTIDGFVLEPGDDLHPIG